MFIDHKENKNMCIFMRKKIIKQNQTFMSMKTNGKPNNHSYLLHISWYPRGIGSLKFLLSVGRCEYKVDISSAFIPFWISFIFQLLGQGTNQRHILWKHWNFKRSPRYFWGRQINNNIHEILMHQLKTPEIFLFHLHTYLL